MPSCALALLAAVAAMRSAAMTICLLAAVALGQDAETCVASDAACSATANGAPRQSMLQTQIVASKKPQANRTLKIIEISGEWGTRTYNYLENCPLPCTQAKSVEDADVVWAYSHATEPKRSHSEQVWVAAFWESPEHYPPRSRDWDYTRSWREDATFKHFELIPKVMADVYDENIEMLKPNFPLPRRVSWAEKKQNSKKMSAWISNCGIERTGRLNMVKDLDAAGVHVASYGRCFHNSDESHQQDQTLLELGISPRESSMYVDSSKYMFFFAAENSNCPYYHTEKVFHALLAGSIPVYLGNPKTIDGYVPKGSIVKAEDFKSTADLAKHLLAVASDETLYNSYFDWWKQNLTESNPAFREKLLTLRPGMKEKRRCEPCTFFHFHGRNPNFNPGSVGCEI